MDFQGSFCQQKMSHLFAFVPTFTNYSNTMNIQVETLIQRKGIKIRISCTLLSLERTAYKLIAVTSFSLISNQGKFERGSLDAIHSKFYKNVLSLKILQRKG